MNQPHALEKMLNWSLAIAAAVYLALFIFNSVTRTGRFSPDSMNYVSVAQNLLTGKGLTQPTVGFNQESFSLDAKPPIPFVEHAPLYPLMIAGVTKLGTSPIRSALLLSAIGSAAVLVLTFGLARALYDERVGSIAAALLLFYYPMRCMSGWAWTDPIALTLLLVWLLLLGIKSRAGDRVFVFIAGLVAGTAFAIRYALGSLFPVGVFFLYLKRDSLHSTIGNILLYALGFAVPASAVLLHNFLAAGLLLPSHSPITGFRENLSAVLGITFGQYFSESGITLQIAILILSVLAISITLVLRRDFLSGAYDLLVSNGRYLLPLWSFAYLVILLVQRCFLFFDLDGRVIAPGGLILVILWSAALIRASQLSIFYSKAFALLCFIVATWQQAQATLQTPPLDFARTIHASERLTWIEKHTTEKDLIIGQDVIDVPFYFNRTDTLSYSPYPQTESANYEKIMTYVHRHCRDYENVYLILQAPPIAQDDCRALFGDFICDLAFGLADQYPGIRLREKLSDGIVFQVDCR